MARTRNSDDYQAILKKHKQAHDRQFAAAVAYARRFCAPTAFLRDFITPLDLEDAARFVRRKGPNHPAQTLNNAQADGLLRKVGSGRYALTAKGRILIEGRSVDDSL